MNNKHHFTRENGNIKLYSGFYNHILGRPLNHLTDTFSLKLTCFKIEIATCGGVDIAGPIGHTMRMPVQRAALCIRNFPSQYRNHFRGLSGHKAGRFNATVFISMLSGERAGVSINSPAAANTSLLASIVRAQTIPSARERCICSGVWRSVTIPS